LVEIKVLADIFGTRIVTIELTISVRANKRIIAIRLTSTIPVEVPPINTRIIAEISIELVPELVGNCAVCGTGAIEIEDFRCIAFVAT